jgi:hypothetical protein
MIKLILFTLIFTNVNAQSRTRRTTSDSIPCTDYPGMFSWSNEHAVSCKWVAKNKEQMACSSDIAKKFCRRSCDLCTHLQQNEGAMLPLIRQMDTLRESNMYSMSLSMQYRSVAPTSNPHPSINPTLRPSIQISNNPTAANTAEPTSNTFAPSSRPMIRTTIKPSVRPSTTDRPYSTSMPVISTTKPSTLRSKPPTNKPTSSSIMFVNYGSTIQLSNVATPITSVDVKRVAMILQSSIQKFSLPGAVVKVTKVGDVSVEESRLLRVLVNSTSTSILVVFNTSISSTCTGTRRCTELGDALFQNSTVLLGEALNTGILVNTIISTAQSQQVPALQSLTIDPNSLVMSTPTIAIDTQSSSQVTSGDGVPSKNHKNRYFLLMTGLAVGMIIFFIYYKKRKEYVETSKDVKIYHDLIQDAPCDSIISPTAAMNGRLPKTERFMNVTVVDKMDVKELPTAPNAFYLDEQSAVVVNEPIRSPSSLQYAPRCQKQSTVIGELTEGYKNELNSFSTLSTHPKKISFPRDNRELGPYMALHDIDSVKYRSLIHQNDPVKGNQTYNVDKRNDHDLWTDYNLRHQNSSDHSEHVGILDHFLDASNNANLLNDSFQVEASIQDFTDRICCSPSQKRSYYFSDTILL